MFSTTPSTGSSAYVVPSSVTYSPPTCSTGIAERAISGSSAYMNSTASTVSPVPRTIVREASRASSAMFEIVSIP